MPRRTLLELVDDILAVNGPLTAEGIINASPAIGRHATPSRLGAKLVRNGFPYDDHPPSFLFYPRSDF